MEQKEPGFKWDYAVTSEIDRVFLKILEGIGKKRRTQKICSANSTLPVNEWESFVIL